MFSPYKSMLNFDEFVFKISVIGDGGVGKTSLIKRYTKDTFQKDYIKTIGAQFSRFSKNIDGNKVHLIFWDIAGQDFLFLHPLFYKESKACIIVYSLEENDLGIESFNHINDWHNELQNFCGNIPVVLFGNKVDLIEKDQLDLLPIQNMIKKRKISNFYLTSAKTGEGVKKAFNAIIEDLYKKSIE
ncbi:MAG: GTP-binding protein [Candidatus Lokiarchaeota archaeon]|nr:GTP-binding protein [Candidatus Lokiarchaeota archaeon]